MSNRIGSQNGPPQVLRESYVLIYATLRRQAAALAYIDAFWMMGTVCLLAIGILFLAKKTKPSQAAMGH